MHEVDSAKAWRPVADERIAIASALSTGKLELCRRNDSCLRTRLDRVAPKPFGVRSSPVLVSYHARPVFREQYTSLSHGRQPHSSSTDWS